MALLIGLTGGIGSGKSAVAEAFRARGVDVVDADEVAHALSEPGNDGYRAVTGAFGDAVIAAGGRLDRAKMRARAFTDPAFRTQLEALLHPLIAAHIEGAVDRFRGAYGVIVAPLLLERGRLMPLVGRVLVVDCPEDEQVRRTVSRSGLPEAEVRAIMATQLSRSARLARADDVVDNSGPHALIAPRVAELDTAYRALAASHA